MNTQLAINEVTEGKTINDVFKALREAGMTAKDYTPLSSDTYFFWDEKENRILYTDKNGNVIYPEEYKTATKANGWYSLSGTIDETAATIKLDKNNIQSEYSVKSAADMSAFINFVKKYSDSFKALASLTINLEADIDLIGADLSFGDVFVGKNVTINGNSHTLKGLYVSENHTQEGNTSDGKSDIYGSALFTSVKDLTVSNLTVEKCVTGVTTLKQGAIFAGQVTGKAKFESVTVKDSVVSGKNKSGILVGYITGGEKTTLSNVTLENNTVIAGEGECGVLFGVALCDTLTDQFGITNLIMKNNTIKFADDAQTKKVEASEVSDIIAEKALPKDGLLGYEVENGVKTGLRIGLADICFVARENFQNKVITATIDGKTVNMAAAIHSIDDLNKTDLKKAE